MKMDRYSRARVRQVGAMLFVYAIFYVCRLAFSASKKGMIEQGAYTPAEIGYVGSALLFAYAIGKVVNGFIADFHPVDVFRIWLQVGNLGLVFVVSDIGTTEGNRLVLLGVGNDGVHFRRVGRLGAEEQAGRAVGVPDEPRLSRSVLARTAREHIDSSAIGALRKHGRCRQQPAGDS